MNYNASASNKRVFAGFMEFNTDSNKLVAKKVESLIVESIDYNDYFKLQKEVSDKNIEIIEFKYNTH